MRAAIVAVDGRRRSIRRPTATGYSRAHACVEPRIRRSDHDKDAFYRPRLWWAAALLASPVSAQQRLTVATYGGNWGEAQKACILDPFAKASGVQVVQETSVSTVTYNKLKQQKGNPSIDIAWIDGGISELAAADGVVATIDPAKIANVSGLIDEAVYKKGRQDLRAEHRLLCAWHCLQHGRTENASAILVGYLEARICRQDHAAEPGQCGRHSLLRAHHRLDRRHARQSGRGRRQAQGHQGVELLRRVGRRAGGVAERRGDRGCLLQHGRLGDRRQGLADRVRRAQGRRAGQRYPRAHRRRHQEPRCRAGSSSTTR